MEPNYPNPFNPTTKINYQLSSPGFVNLVLYNFLGQEIERLVNRQHDAGFYEASWNASTAASGMYFLRMTVNNQSGQNIYQEMKKLLLVK